MTFRTLRDLDGGPVVLGETVIDQSFAALRASYVYGHATLFARIRCHDFEPPSRHPAPERDDATSIPVLPPNLAPYPILRASNCEFTD
jgi:hypothetical protein